MIIYILILIASIPIYMFITNILSNYLLSGMDNLLLYQSDSTRPPIIGGLIELEKLPNINSLKYYLNKLIKLHPRLNKIISNKYGINYFKTTLLNLDDHIDNIESEKPIEEIISGLFSIDLSIKKPLWMIHLIKTNNKYYILLRIHHLICDGPCLKLLINSFNDDIKRKKNNNFRLGNIPKKIFNIPKIIINIPQIIFNIPKIIFNYFYLVYYLIITINLTDWNYTFKDVKNKQFREKKIKLQSIPFEKVNDIKIQTNSSIPATILGLFSSSLSNNITNSKMLCYTTIDMRFSQHPTKLTNKVSTIFFPLLINKYLTLNNNIEIIQNKLNFFKDKGGIANGSVGFFSGLFGFLCNSMKNIFLKWGTENTGVIYANVHINRKQILFCDENVINVYGIGVQGYYSLVSTGYMDKINISIIYDNDKNTQIPKEFNI